MASSSGPRQTAVLLLEDARTNLVLHSENLKAASWTNAGLVLTSGQADPMGGTAAYLIEDDSTAAQDSVRASSQVTGTSSGVMCMSWFAKEGTTASTSGSRHFLDSSSGTALIDTTLTWSSGVPSLTIVNVGSSGRVPERWRDGWWRFETLTSAAQSTGTFTPWHFAARTVGDKGDTYIFGTQIEV